MARNQVKNHYSATTGILRQILKNELINIFKNINMLNLP